MCLAAIPDWTQIPHDKRACGKRKMRFWTSRRQAGSNSVTSCLPVIRPESAISSKRAIVLPTRLTCCFPKGSVASFLLETKMAVL